MSSVCIFGLLTLAQLAAGFGVLSLLRVSLKPGLWWPLSALLGIAVFSLVPFLLQLCHVPLTAFTVFGSLALVCVVLNLRWRAGMTQLKAGRAGGRWQLKVYELPFLLLIGLIVFVSVWRCFYFPPLPRDLTSGSEAIAEYAVREHTMINSVFSINLQSTNNTFKPPFAICLQLIYKLAGFPFGQGWLSVLFISFTVFIYRALSQSLHRLIAGMLLLFFLAIPELYAYTFMVLFDYSNTVFFFLSVYFLLSWMNNGPRSQLALTGMLMGIATYVRSETLVLAVMILPLILWQLWRRSQGIKTMAATALLFTGPTVLLYALSIPLYLNYYLPVKYRVPDLVNTHLFNLHPLFKRWTDMNRQLIFSKFGIELYGYFIFLFVLLLAAELVVTRKLTTAGRNWLYAVLVIYLGLPFLGYLLPLMDLDNTTKRGLFKLFPLMLFYMANNRLLLLLSDKITRWEQGKA